MNLGTDGALKREIPLLIAIVLYYEKLNNHKESISRHEYLLLTRAIQCMSSVTILSVTSFCYNVSGITLGFRQFLSRKLGGEMKISNSTFKDASTKGQHETISFIIVIFHTVHSFIQICLG